MGCQVATCFKAPRGVMNGGSGVSIGGVRTLRVVENKQTYVNLSNLLGYPSNLHPHFTYAPLSLRDWHSGFFQ